MKLISANSRLFTPIEMRLSTLIRECSAIIFALTEYEAEYEYFHSQAPATRLYYLQTINQLSTYLIRKINQTLEYTESNKP